MPITARGAVIDTRHLARALDDAALPIAPVALAQLALVELARGEPRQFVVRKRHLDCAGLIWNTADGQHDEFNSIHMTLNPLLFSSRNTILYLKHPLLVTKEGKLYD